MLLFNRLERYGFRQQFYFNTSNVTIQQIDFEYELYFMDNFNTSNVTIQLDMLYEQVKGCGFQYI